MIEVDPRGYIDDPNATTYNLLGQQIGFASDSPAIAIIYYAQWSSFWLDRIVTDLIVYHFMIYFTTLFAKTQQLFFPGIAKTIWDGDQICIY